MHNITAYKVHDSIQTIIRPASKEREWMDEAHGRYPYRCLPLTMANQHGWEFCLSKKVEVIWNGGNEPSDVRVVSDVGNHAIGLFGYGILTFHTGYLIKTDPEFNLFISGSPNHIKPNIQALTGVYESSWAPYSFTMNWKITEPNKIIRFDEGEPFCFVYPLPSNLIEDFNMSIEPLVNNQELSEQYNIFTKSRSGFIQDKKDNPRDAALAGGWQKHYFQGKYPDGSKCPFGAHKTKYSLSDPMNAGVQSTIDEELSNDSKET